MRAEALEGCPEVGLANDSGNCHLHYVIKTNGECHVSLVQYWTFYLLVFSSVENCIVPMGRRKEHVKHVTQETSEKDTWSFIELIMCCGNRLHDVR